MTADSETATVIDGKVRAVSEGETMISCISADAPDVVATCKVKVIPISDEFLLEQIKAVEGITKDNVRLEDKEALKKARRDLEKALEKNQSIYTTVEKEMLHNRFEEIEAALKIIENVEKVIDLINTLPSADKITAADMDSVKEAKAAYDALTEHAKTLVNTEIKSKLDASVEVLKTLDKEHHAEKNPTAATVKVSQIKLRGISKKIAAESR